MPAIPTDQLVVTEALWVKTASGQLKGAAAISYRIDLSMRQQSSANAHTLKSWKHVDLVNNAYLAIRPMVEDEQASFLSIHHGKKLNRPIQPSRQYTALKHSIQREFTTSKSEDIHSLFH